MGLLDVGAPAVSDMARCPVCGNPPVPFGGEDVCMCPDEEREGERSDICRDCGQEWGTVWGFCDNCDTDEDDEC